MKPIHKMKVIQLEVTNACGHSCSNCTRFCGHYKKPFFMDFETFARAVDSMEGFPGMVGIMGGEPTLHPEFARLVEYYREKTDGGRVHHNGLAPIKNFSRHLIENDMRDIKQKRGLWSSLGEGYYKNYELIQETFPFQLINDHSHPGLHQTLLVTRRELGIPDNQWVRMRDNCWAQNLWSASVTPKGCFFCEVAAALDMLFDGPGGWPIEKGWWKRGPEDFGEQLGWCEYCSAVLNVPRVRANTETDVVSPAILEKLKAVGSPKINRGKFKIFDVSSFDKNRPGCEYASDWYLPGGDNTTRVASTNKSLLPRSLEAVVVAAPGREFPAAAMASLGLFDKAVVADFTGNVKSDAAMVVDVSSMSLEKGLDLALSKLDFKDWVMFLEADTALSSDFREKFFSWIFNPGCLYCFGPRRPSGDASGWPVPEEAAAPLASDTAPRALPFLFILANRNAAAARLPGGGVRPPSEFIRSWPRWKVVEIGSLESGDEAARLDLLSKGEKQKTALMTAHMLSMWRGLSSTGVSIALFGGGAHSEWLLEKLLAAGLPPPSVIFDDDPHRAEIQGVPVARTSEKDARRTDVVVVSSDTYSEEMTRRALETWGGGKTVVVNPYADFTSPHFQK